MMEAIRSSETSVLTRAARRNIPEDYTLHSHSRENLKSYIPIGFDVLRAVVMDASTVWDITPVVRCKSTHVSEDHIASIFRVDAATCIHAGFLLGLVFDPEDGGDMFPEISIGVHLTMALTSTVQSP
jgi:hypothetical protein